MHLSRKMKEKLYFCAKISHHGIKTALFYRRHGGFREHPQRGTHLCRQDGSGVSACARIEICISEPTVQVRQVAVMQHLEMLFRGQEGAFRGSGHSRHGEGLEAVPGLQVRHQRMQEPGEFERHHC